MKRRLKIDDVGTSRIICVPPWRHQRNVPTPNIQLLKLIGVTTLLRVLCARNYETTIHPIQFQSRLRLYSMEEIQFNCRAILSINSSILTLIIHERSKTLEYFKPTIQNEQRFQQSCVSEQEVFNTFRIFYFYSNQNRTIFIN